ncbi:hypothetical protein Ancab_022321 [Ancistrocladus abbreviatus]
MVRAREVSCTRFYIQAALSEAETLRYNLSSQANRESFETDAISFSMSVLIEGLPDAVVLRCLARVPFHLYPKLELVSRSWRAALRSP